jgi:hypothetical protein
LPDASTRSLPADSCAARLRAFATMPGTRFSTAALRPIAARDEMTCSWWMRSRFSRRTACRAALSA